MQEEAFKMSSSDGRSAALGLSALGPLSARQVPSLRSKNVVQVAAKAGNLRKEGE
jgi:hypothetical protein